MKGAAAYQALFELLAAERRGAFVPFVVLGDPDPESSLAIVRTMARSGAAALELGLPFSDPVADGPAIQAASSRALAAGTRIEDCWMIIKTIREEFPGLPLGLLVYANLALHAGAGSFYGKAAAAGVDSVLVADAPLIESEPLERIAVSHGIAPVLIAPPNASEDRLTSIAHRSRGYVYVTSRPGVTGVRQDLDDAAARVIRQLHKMGSAPPLLGFGISNPDQVRKAIKMGAAGAISGSAVAGIIERTRPNREAVQSEIASFVSNMRNAASTIDRIRGEKA